jgi:hypothetical protein
VGLPRDVTPYGSQTVMGPGWPNVEEEQLALAAAEYSALATKLTGSVVPLQQSQLESLTAQWTGAGSIAAAGEATSIIAGHEANAAHAATIALKLQAMEVSVAKTKALVNATAEEVQQECMALQAASGLVSNTEELIQSRIKMGLSQNIAYVSEGAAEIANGLGVPPSMPSPGAPPAAQASQAADKGSQQATQMMMQMGQVAMQLPQQLGQMVTQAPQQLMQQVSQPLQQLTSIFGGKGGSGGGLGGASPFAAFSNHPLAGGSGASGGGGMVQAASLPGSGGSPAQTPMMANLVGTTGDAAVRPARAGSMAVGGVAPVATGMGGMGGGMGMMGQRGEAGGGTAASLAPPPALEYDLGDEVDDAW